MGGALMKRHKMRVYKPSRVVSVLALLTVLGLVACAINPVTGKKELSLISEDQEVAMGVQNYPVMTQISGGLYQDKGLQNYVSQVGKKLVAVSHRPDLPFQFNVVNSGEVNAYALPGGKISITRGLISEMQNEAQLAAVLGHEVGHVTARHVNEMITRQILTQSAAVGLSIYLQQQDMKNADYYSAAGMMAAQLMMLRFSRDNERQSDELGMDYVIKAGYNPQGMVELQEILLAAHESEPSRLEALLLTHPLSSERIETARQRITTLELPPGLTMGQQTFHQKTARMHRMAPAYLEYERGEALLAEGKVQPSINAFEKAINMAPGQAVFHADLGVAYVQAKEYRKARQNLNKALQLYPELFQSRFYSGFHFVSIQRWDLALGEFNKCDRLIPEQPGVRYYQGFCFEKQGNRDKAVAHYRQVLNIDPQGNYGKLARQHLQGMGQAVQ
jgi:predicted Zn-dependent protease